LGGGGRRRWQRGNLATWKTGLALGMLRASASRIQQGQEGTMRLKSHCLDRAEAWLVSRGAVAPSRGVLMIRRVDFGAQCDILSLR
jgi:hypothetical protein